ncbi:MAG: hypothetical protein ACRD0H_27820 [Actinomycetes bacterium]
MNPPALVVLGAPSGEGAKAGPWGLAIILLLCVACYFLFKSMSKHMRRVREQFPAEPGPTKPDAGQTGAGADSATAPSLVKADRPPGPDRTPRPHSHDEDADTAE